ncbi:MAG: hypothetical protein K2M72_07530 [Paramuribaculum sp.]|nr:hypothetical protein [Paramuribaculum sp.]
MKKLFRLLLIVFAFAVCNYTFTACDKDDDSEYYAGESEEDYKPNVYTIESTWDLSGVSGLTAQQKKELQDQLAAEINGSQTFQTRAAAVAAFDASVEELRNAEAPAGMKATITLKRSSAIIKRANLKW